MNKVADKLYVASCNECSADPVLGATYICCCQRPCGSFKTQANMPVCPIASPAASIINIPLINTEIPPYHAVEFNRYLDLLDYHLQHGEVVLVSELGESRAPSLALLWLVFRSETLSRSSFAAARMDFSRIYPRYLPWPGWIIFFEQEWDAFR
ncbi:MAG: hypothetical protein HGA76_07675 [Candidatus Firestonebacteria bacterium]|nr:hypothetical protein [Candidatus Firestonebacteria bacterium]